MTVIWIAQIFLKGVALRCFFFDMQRMVNDLARIAQATNSDQYTSVTQDMALRKQGLECLVTIMKSLVEWSKDLAVSTDPLRTCNCLPFLKSFTEEAEKDEPTEAASSTPNIDAQSPPPADVDFAEPSGDNDVETFKKQKALKATMEEGRSRFNQNPKNVFFRHSHSSDSFSRVLPFL